MPQATLVHRIRTEDGEGFQYKARKVFDFPVLSTVPGTVYEPEPGGLLKLEFVHITASEVLLYGEVLEWRDDPEVERKSARLLREMGSAGWEVERL